MEFPTLSSRWYQGLAIVSCFLLIFASAIMWDQASDLGIAIGVLCFLSALALGILTIGGIFYHQPIDAERDGKLSSHSELPTHEPQQQQQQPQQEQNPQNYHTMADGMARVSSPLAQFFTPQQIQWGANIWKTIQRVPPPNLPPQQQPSH